MILNFLKLKDMKVPDETVTWMSKHGTNHQFLQDTWKEEPESEFATSLERVVECMAYELQQPTINNYVFKRLHGKFNSLRKQHEDSLLRQCKAARVEEMLR